MSHPLKVLKDQFGSLIEAPSATLQSAANAGVVPSSPTEAAVGGAGPDAAKMAGTPAQTSAPTALGRAPQVTRLGPEAGQTLQSALRAERSGPQAGMSEDQAKKQVTAKRMEEQFGDLGAKVQSLIEAATPVAPVAAPTAPTLTDASKKLTPEQLTAVQAVAANPTVETIAAARAALGGQDPLQYLNGADSTAIAASIASATPDQIFLDDQTLQKLGYSPADIAAALGVDPAALKGMTLQQMQTQIEQQLQMEHSSVEQLRAKLDDPALGPNERAQLRSQLSALGANGVYASEQEVDALQATLADATTVEFNGELLSIEDLLGDDHMTSMVTKFLDDPEFAKKLRETEPEFAKFIDSHANALKEIALHVDDAGKKFDDIQTTNKQLVDSLTSVGITGGDQLLAAIIPGYKPGMSTSAIDVTKFPGLSLLTDSATATKAGIDRAALAKQMNELIATSPEFAQELMHMTPQQIVALGGGRANSPEFADFVRHARDVTQLKAIDPSDGEALIDYLFGSKSATPQSAMEFLAEQQKNAGGALLGYLLDDDHDGKMDDPKVIHKRVMDEMAKGDGGLSIAGSLLDRIRRPAESGAETAAKIQAASSQGVAPSKVEVADRLRKTDAYTKAYSDDARNLDVYTQQGDGPAITGLLNRIRDSRPTTEAEVLRRADLLRKYGTLQDRTNQ